MTHLRRALAALAVAPFLATAAPAQTLPATLSDDACNGTWSPPLRLTRSGDLPVYIEPGVIVPLGKRTLALGTPTFFWMGREHIWPVALRTDTAGIRWSVTRPGALVDSVGNATPLPAIGHAEHYDDPVLVAASGDEATVAWEVADVGSDGRPAEPTRVNLATVAAGEWTVPEVVLRGRSVTLHAPAASRDGEDGAPMLVVSISDSAGSALALIRRNGLAWSVALWRAPGVVHYAAVAPVADGAVMLLMTTWMARDARPGIFALRGVPMGDTVAWEQPVRIATLGRRYSQFTAARVGGDSVVVAWRHSSDDGAPDELRTAISSDGGRNWVQATPLPSHGGIDSERALIDASGGVHLIFRGAAVGGALNAPGRIMHAAWRDGRWTRPVAIASTESVTGPAAGTAPGGRLMAVWTEAMIDPDEGMLPRSLVSFWSPGCGTSSPPGSDKVR